MFNKKFILLYLFSTLFCQPDAKFGPFDWVLYKGSGAITSITEGYTYTYIGTKDGGLKRFNQFGNVFDDPITVAQGLKDNHITATYFDQNTGLIWISTPKYLQYSFSREGNWFDQKLIQLGLSNFDRIKRIGSTNKFIWLQAKSSFVKLDNTTGGLIGIYSKPDELDVKWGSYYYDYQTTFENILLNYHILDGWSFNNNVLFDKLGRQNDITACLIGKYGNVYFGANDGTLFYGNSTMETLYPIIPDIMNVDVNTIFESENYFWIGSQDYIASKGISKIDLQSRSSYTFLFEETINMIPSSIYSLEYSNNELWAGGENIILYYDQKKDYWRTITESRGIPNGIIWDLCIERDYIWIGSSGGLSRLELSTKYSNPIGIEPYFTNIPVYDIELIQNKIWIGARNGLYIYSHHDPQIIRADDWGRKNFSEQIYFATAIKYLDQICYIVTDIGIIRFDFDKNEWDLIFPSAVYQNKMIYSLAVNDKYLFLGTDNSLIRIEIKTGLIKDYGYEFIGKVNDLILKENLIWLGTRNGLVKFKWKKDL